jgi:hypothetical protein
MSDTARNPRSLIKGTVYQIISEVYQPLEKQPPNRVGHRRFFNVDRVRVLLLPDSINRCLYDARFGWRKYGSKAENAPVYAAVFVIFNALHGSDPEPWLGDRACDLS